MDEPTEKNISRRNFLINSAIAGTSIPLGLQAVGAPAISAKLGANDRIRVGFIGVGNRGTQLLHGFMNEPDIEVAALCDVYQPLVLRDYSKVDAGFIAMLGGRIPKMGEDFGKDVGRYEDFRRVLDRKDIDAVVIATPDHWHALQTIMACEAGKDVYVEKPLTVTVAEGRRMVEAAKQHKRVVQVGLQRRASRTYQELAALIQSEKIGKVTIARAYRISNMSPLGIGKGVNSKPPAGLNWDLWLGPRAMRPYNENIPLYKFRWWQAYSSQMGNWGVHYFDAIRWLLGEDAPISISAHGGKFAIDDDRTIPDTIEAIFEFASGRLLVFGQYEASSGKAIVSGEIELRGVNATLYASESGYRIDASSGGQFQRDEPRMESIEVKAQPEDPTSQLIRNFIDCVKSRQTCACDLETGHRSTTFAHLANIALQTRARLDWHPANERFTNNDAANKLLDYDYREPWNKR
ncbi:Gfo/Idh/MocA family oxidoreductase [candidate division KSB1 bacterium]|nr:Gfo/Idh/MocA family oxidoreductase [candidate division KSB1 bacterium]